MDSTILYLGYCQLGRETFLNKAKTSLVLRGDADPKAASTAETPLSAIDPARFDPGDTQAAAGVQTKDGASIRVYPLVKKIGGAFAEMITVGRTPNNDVQVPHQSVSRFHVFFRDDPDGWIICDPGSKNGTFVDNRKLITRAETNVASDAAVQLGDILGTFYSPENLFTFLEPLTQS